MPGPLISGLAAGEDRRDCGGPGPAASWALLDEGRTQWHLQDLAETCKWPSVGKARGWQEGACGKDQARGAGRTPVGNFGGITCSLCSTW